MTYVSMNYYLFVVVLLLVYYIFPKKKRWYLLLIGNCVFYAFFCRNGWWIFLLTILLSYCDALILAKLEGKKRKIALCIGIIISLTPWILLKSGIPYLLKVEEMGKWKLMVPIGISFYTLQVIAYLADVYQKRIEEEKNIAKYALFVSFFPQLIQGPIPRSEQLKNQLVEGHLFDEKKFTKGFCYIIWGFFLKLVVADKAGIIVNAIYDNYPAYKGCYIWIGSFLFSIQLYADFFACTTLAQGVSMLFGIELKDNFARPYFANSIKDFWRRWHISLSAWLKDYIYIPLGGSYKGKNRKYLNILITFAVSGLWHGSGMKYIVWGIIHGVLQVVEDICAAGCNWRIKQWFKFRKTNRIKQIGTFLLVNFAWIFFRAESVKIGVKMIVSMFIDFNFWVLFNNRIFTLGLEWKDWLVLIGGIIAMWKVDKLHEAGVSMSEMIIKQKLIVRWSIYILTILCILLVGTYGYGFDAQDFIYGGF